VFDNVKVVGVVWLDVELVDFMCFIGGCSMMGLVEDD